MSLTIGPSRREFTGMTPQDYIRYDRPGGTGGLGVGSGMVTNSTAMRHSAVWACLRLRADLVSTFPINVFREVDDYQVGMPKPPVLIEPGGREWNYTDWMYASQVDFDRSGNIIGLITERNAVTTPRYPQGLPSRIDLQSSSACSVIERKGVGLRYRINGTEYGPEQVWHEKQYPVPGLAVGLSPVAHAAWTVSEGLTMQQFALAWFNSGGVPKARMKNMARKLKPGEATAAKQWYKDVMQHGDLLVTGADWEYEMISAKEADTSWIEGRRFGLADIARFFGCPADLIEAAVSAGGAITYASISQRNLQFLILNLGPTIVRRETNLSNLLPRPRFVKINTDALLRMDPKERAEVMKLNIESRLMTNTEARKLNNQFPLTDADIAEFEKIYGPAKASPTPAASTPPKNKGAAE